MTITSGSGLERFVMCRASNVLHRTYDESGNRGTTRGTEAHAYLQRISEGMEAAESLDLVDERFRDNCQAIDIEDLRDVLGLAPELAIAYKPSTDTARVLGAGLGREYDKAGVGEDEIPLTVDVAGIDNPSAPSVGIVVDYKTGWQKLAAAERNYQMRGGAIALARAFDLDEVHVQLIHLRDDLPARRDTAVFTAADLAVIASEFRLRWALAVNDREKYAARRDVPDATRGSWCRYCPSYNECPGNRGLVQAAVAGEHVKDLAGPLSPEHVADAFRRLRDLREPLKRLEQSIYAAAREHPVLIETLPDGTEVWLGMTETQGNERLDAAITRDVVSEMLGEDSVDKVCEYSVTKGRLEAAIKLKVPRGYGAAKMRAVLAEIKKRNGAHRPTKHEVDLYKIRRQLPAAKAS